MSDGSLNQDGVDEARATDFVLLLIGLAASPLGFRFLQASQASVSLGVGDLRGLLADVGLAFTIGGLIALALATLGRFCTAFRKTCSRIAHCY